MAMGSHRRPYSMARDRRREDGGKTTRKPRYLCICKRRMVPRMQRFKCADEHSSVRYRTEQGKKFRGSLMMTLAPTSLNKVSFLQCQESFGHRGAATTQQLTQRLLSERHGIRVATVARYQQPQSNPLLNAVQRMAGADPERLRQVTIAIATKGGGELRNVGKYSLR